MKSDTRVLVVDDSELCLELARDALESCGLEVITTDSPLGSSRIVREMRPHVLVVDISMPALDGNMLTNLIRRSHPECKIILHSDRSADELATLAVQCGADGAAVKSADCGELVREVRRVLRRPPPTRPTRS
jgi:DNA-binding response OmpR family regulator